MNIEDAALVTAVIDALGPKKRDELIKAAIENHLLKTDRRYDGSPLQRAFNVAVEQAASEIVKELLQKPEYRSQVEEFVKSVFDNITDASREEMARVVGEGMARGLWNRG